MKLSVIFLFVFSFLYSFVDAQTVTISGKNIPLEKVFKTIKKQTGYLFLYNEEIIKSADPVTIDVKNETIARVLDLCLRNKPFEYSIVEKTILVKTREEPASQQKDIIKQPGYTIHGKITDADGVPVEGASVFLKTSRRGMATIADGRFSISDASNGDVLVVSSTTYELKEITLAGLPEKNEFTIPLAIRQESMDEITVTTAYGVERQSRQLGYSTATVSGKEITQANPANFLNGLAGKVSGMNISTLSTKVKSDIRVVLRGVRSITGNNLPLFVLNGMILSLGSDQISANNTMDMINNINPADVESVTVLKGANAAALYGPEGINGVIIINTKKGKGRTQISFQHATSFQQVDPRWPKFQDKFGPGFMVDEFGDGIYDPLGSYMHWGPAYNGEEVTIGRPDENGDVQKVPYLNTNERKKFWDVGHTIQNNLSFSGGDDQSDFFLNLNNTSISGIIPGDKINRNGIRLNAGRKYSKLFSIGVNLAYTRSTQDISQANVMNAIRNTGGHIKLTSYTDFRNNKWADENHYYNDYYLNPYQELATRRNKTTGNSLFGNIEFKLTPFKWLDIIDRVGLTYNGEYSKATVEAIKFSEFAKNSGRIVSFADQPAQVIDGSGSSTGLNNDLLVTAKAYHKDFSLRATVGNSVRENYFKNIGVMGYQLIVPGVYNVRNNNGPISGSETNRLTRAYSFFGSATIGFREFAFIEFSGRKDWDSKLAASARSKNFYGGANTSLIISDIFPSIKTSTPISFARLRASVTNTANMNIGPYEIETSFFTANGFPYGPVASYTLNIGQSNPHIKPERVVSQEYGGEISFFKNRITAGASYYFQQNNDQIMTISMPSSTGYGSSKINAGEFHNKGWEFDLRIDPVVSLPEGFSVNVSGQFAVNNSKVISLNKGQQYLMLSNELRATVGEPAFVYMLSDWKRDPEGRVIVNKISGFPELDPEGRKLGRSVPQYTGGINLSINYNNLSLRAVAEYRGGVNYFHGAAAMATMNGQDILSAINGRQRFVFPNSVYEENGKYVPNNDVVVQEANSYLLGSLFSSVGTNFYTSGSFWKIREMVLAYTVPLKTKWIQSSTIALTARNLFTFIPKTNKWGDPELGAGYESYSNMASSNTAGSGSDDYTLPGTRFFGFNVNLVF